MVSIKAIKAINFGNLYIPTFITFLALHLNHMILTIAQYSSKLFTFDFSDPTILNYLEAFSNKNKLFEYQGYPTANLQTYQPGPLPYTYVFKFSWIIHNYLEINPIYLSNIILIIYPTILLIIGATILYRNDLKLLSLMTLSLTLLVQYTNNNFNGSNRGSQRSDLGTDYIALITTLTLMMVILSYKKPDSSHIPLLAFSGLLLNNHFTAFAIAPFTIIYGLYQISISVRAKKYKINYKIILPLSILIYLPLIYRFIVQPLYLYDALTRKTQTSGDRLFPDLWTYFYKTTPLEIFINPCDKGASEFNKMACLPYDYLKFYIAILLITSLIILYQVLKKQTLLIKLITLSSLLLINYNTMTGFEAKHSSIAAGLSLSVIIYLLSRNKTITSIGIISILILINYYSTNNYKFTNGNIYKNYEKVNFSSEFISKLKTTKLKIDLCYLTREDNCSQELYTEKKNLPTSYFPNNLSHVTILELLKNNVDLCIIDKNGLVLNNGKNGLLRKIDNLICSEKENQDSNRNQLYLTREHNFEAPATHFEYIKIASVINEFKSQCTDPYGYNYLSCQDPYYILESMNYPGAGLYLKKNSKGINPTELLNLNNKVYENILTQLPINSKNNCSLYFMSPSKDIQYCFKEKSLDFIITESSIKTKVDLYDPR